MIIRYLERLFIKFRRNKKPMRGCEKPTEPIGEGGAKNGKKYKYPLSFPKVHIYPQEQFHQRSPMSAKTGGLLD
jgi:hypothetical protein